MIDMFHFTSRSRSGKIFDPKLYLSSIHIYTISAGVPQFSREMLFFSDPYDVRIELQHPEYGTNMTAYVW